MNNPYLVCSDRELRALPTQWLLAERWEKAGSLLNDINFAEAKTGRVGIDELLKDYTTALRLLPKDNSWLEKLKAINRVLDRQAHGLRNWNVQEKPVFFFQQIRQMRNEVFARDLYQWQTQAEIELVHLKQPYVLERFPISSHSAELRTLGGHTGSVNSVALSADGQLAVSASSDKTLKVWDVGTGLELRTLEGHKNAVKSVALSVDGRLAISASDNNIIVWDVSTGRELRTFIGHNPHLRGVALSANGKLAVSVAIYDLKVWDVVTGRELHRLAGHGYQEMSSVAISADGQLAISAAYNDYTLKVWDTATGRELRTLEGHKDAVKSVALSADGRLGISASYEHGMTLKVWDMANGHELQRLKGHRRVIISVALSMDGRLAISAAEDGTFKVWDVSTGRELCTFTGQYQVSSIALSADGRLAISAAKNGTLKVWDVSTLTLSKFNGQNAVFTKRHKTPLLKWERLKELASLFVFGSKGRKILQNKISRHEEPVRGVAVSSDGRLATSFSWDIKVWDVRTGRALRTIIDWDEKGRSSSRNSRAHEMGMSADAKIVVSAGRPTVWEISTGRKLRTFKGHELSPVRLALSADGRLAISGSNDNTTRVWDVPTGRELCALKWRGNPMLKALSADGRVAIAASDYDLIVWDISLALAMSAAEDFNGGLAAGRVLSTQHGYSQRVNDIALAADGRLAVFASSDKTIKVWDIVSGTELRTLTGHNGSVSGVALSTHGQLAVSVSLDNTLKVWDVETGHCIATLVVGVPLICCALSADGKTIIAGDDLGWVHFLELVGEDEVPESDQKAVEVRPTWLPRWLKRTLRLYDFYHG